MAGDLVLSIEIPDLTATYYFLTGLCFLQARQLKSLARGKYKYKIKHHMQLAEKEHPESLQIHVLSGPWIVQEVSLVPLSETLKWGGGVLKPDSLNLNFKSVRYQLYDHVCRIGITISTSKYCCKDKWGNIQYIRYLEQERSIIVSYFLLNYAIHFDTDFNKCLNPNLNSQNIMYIDI